MKHIELVGERLLDQYYVLCGCKIRPMFDSPEAASDAWNRANPNAED